MELTYSEKNKLRKLYASYKEACNEMDDTWKMQINDSFREEFPQLADKHLRDLPELIYSKNQLQFINDMVEEGYDISYTYSGRGMFGEVCPAVVTSEAYLPTKAKVQADSMGLEIVFYAQF